MYYQRLESPLGPLTAWWSDRGLSQFSFGDAATAIEQSTTLTLSLDLPLTDQQREVAQAVHLFFECGELDFDLALLDWTDVPPFHRRVLECCSQIERSRTLTYGQLAAKVGSPQAARAVGQAMARNRWPILIPCHRVVGRDGRLTGYSGAGGMDTKRALLDFEFGRAPLTGIGLNAMNVLQSA